MAEITNIRPQYDVSPVLAGFLGAGVLVVSVTVAVFLWTCCQRRYRQLTGSYKLGGDAARDPPYRFIHMLKGISIYPETLSNSRKIVRVARRLGPRGPRDREWCRSGGNAGGGVLLVDAAENGLLGGHRLQVKPGTEPGAGRELPVQPNGCSQEGNDASSSSCEASETASPSSPAQERSLGTLSLAVDYNFPKKALVVTILEARGLPAVDEQSNSSDPYIKMTILPEKKHRVKTRVMRKTLDPAFDETFTFYGVPYSTLPELVLHFLVLSFDRFSRDDVIGEAVVPLAGVDPSTGRVQLTQEICKRTIQCVSRGELLVSLSYQPVTQRLNVVVLKAKHLPKVDITGLSGNPYVKVNVFYGRKRIAKKKTHVKKGTLNPVFNETFVYDVPAELLRDVSVEFLVIDFDRTTKNEVFGRLVLGAHSSCSSAAAHWREVCETPRRQVAKWHNLSEH
ncbi:synaptotagmin-11-like [Scleropages formosus]|uniref:Synaptotagmin XIa n=2 Tax=Scleropages formosus TaxID=113540 RepID=A0A8C9V1I9_SCLFO|nr:synaptotagmin-11-like [Scleropages formosus]